MTSSYKIQARETGGLWVTVDILFCAADAWEALHRYLMDRPSFVAFRLTYGGRLLYMEGNAND